MRRRDFLSLVGGATVTPLSVHAQQALPVVGVLHGLDGQSFAPQMAAYRQALKEGGFEEGRNITIEYRWAEGKLDRLPALAADLVRRNVSVISTTGGNASGLAAKRATDIIPIVFNSGSDPIKLGLVTNLSRPGGNVTGVSFFISDLIAKGIDLLHQLIPSAKTIVAMVDPTTPEAASQPGDAREAARKLGMEISIINASNDTEIEQAFAAATRAGVGAVIIGGSPSFGGRIASMTRLAAQHRIPTMYYRRDFVAAGGLVSYGTSVDEAYRQNGLYVAKILQGAKPADLPVLQAAKFEFVINMKTAKSLGLEFHPQLLATADEVIE